MADSTVPRPAGTLEWPAFGPDDVFRARELVDLQYARRELLRRHLRYLHGPGIVCGLRVVAAPTPAWPWRVRVCPGYGVGPCGDELWLRSGVLFNLADAPPVHSPQARQRRLVVLALRLAVDVHRPRGAWPSACGCATPQRHPSRATDLVHVVVVETIPERPGRAGDICSGETPSCPPCPDSCDLPIATVRLPASSGQPIADTDIEKV
jgi:hypothetical protein